MGKFNEIDLTIKEIKRFFKENILTIILLFVMFTLIHIAAYEEQATAQEKENRINTIESRLNEQMNYIHQLEADVDNLYRVVE